MDPDSAPLFGDMPSPHLPSLESSPPNNSTPISAQIINHIPIHQFTNPNCPPFNATQNDVEQNDFMSLDDDNALPDWQSPPTQQFPLPIASWLDDQQQQQQQQQQPSMMFPIHNINPSSHNRPDLNLVTLIPISHDDADSVDDTSPPSHLPAKQNSNSIPISNTNTLQFPLQHMVSNAQPTSRKQTTSNKKLKQELLTTVASSPSTARGNVSHTRRCRAKVNNNFERLLGALPPPPKGVEVKHKAQILAYAIDRFRAVRCQNMHLEMKLALSSPYQMQRWVRSVVSSSQTLEDALKPFMALVCLTKKWKYAELWAPYTRSSTSNQEIQSSAESTALRYITGALPPTVQGEELKRLRRYRCSSRKFTFPPRFGVPGRVFLTMRPEWLPLLNDEIAFPRAPHAVKHKVEVTFAVPVIVNGAVHMVVEFFDTDRRDYDPETMNLANDIAVMFGKAFTGRNQQQYGSPSTT